MARKTVTVMISDLSGQEIPDDQYAKVVITNGNSRYVADVSRIEVAELIANARKSKRPGRRAKA
jgi:hypothetical protein